MVWAGDLLRACFSSISGSRKVHVAGMTPHPDQPWMTQIARNVTMEEWGFLSPGQYLIHDRDGKYCPAFQQIIDVAGVKRVPLPPRVAEFECVSRSGGCARSRRKSLSRLILFGERARHALTEYVEPLSPGASSSGQGQCGAVSGSQRQQQREGPIQCRERLGGLLKYYDREAA